MRDYEPSSPRLSRARTTILIIAAMLFLGLGGVAVYGLLTPPRPVNPTSSQSATAPATTTTTASPQLSASPMPGHDPQVFARLVAETLFDWDTTADTPAAVRDRLLVWADPTGDETNGLVSDLGMYLPDPDTWATMRGYATVQTLQIDSVETPSSWPGVVASAAPGSLLPGTSAWTVTGVRHREGVAFGQPTSVDRPVSFTMFVTCAPSFPECHLMRLGQLDNPMQ